MFGFQAENLKRNRNLLRPLYDPRSGLPFAKPRFILTDQGIQLINIPVLEPDRLADTLRDIDTWELRPHEYFYDPEDFQGAWWQNSKLLATVVDLKVHGPDRWLLKRIIFEEKSDEQQLGWSLVQAFNQEVAATGARFMIVHLPSRQEMELRAGLGRWSYQTFLDALDDGFEVVHPEDELGARPPAGTMARSSPGTTTKRATGSSRKQSFPTSRNDLMIPYFPRSPFSFLSSLSFESSESLCS